MDIVIFTTVPQKTAEYGPSFNPNYALEGLSVRNG